MELPIHTVPKGDVASEHERSSLLSGRQDCIVIVNEWISEFDQFLAYHAVLLKGRSWIVKRSYEDFRILDKHLHLCIYDRRFSQLTELPRLDSLADPLEVVFLLCLIKFVFSF